MNYYKVRNRQDLQSIESQVKQICDTQNARAYIVSNPRSEKEINSFLPTYQKRFNSQDPRYVHAYEILAGQPKHDPTKFPTRKMFFLDVDTEDHYVWRLTKMIIKSYGITPVGEYTTPSGGLHIILPDGYAKEIPDLVHIFVCLMQGLIETVKGISSLTSIDYSLYMPTSMVKSYYMPML